MSLAKITAKAAAALSTIARDLSGLAGASAIAYGAWLIYRPAGFIVGGVLLLAGSLLLARSE